MEPARGWRLAAAWRWRVNEIPVGLMIAPVFAVIAIAWVLYGRFVAPKRMDQQYSQFRASELAPRLGLSLVAGDPNFNFFIRQANEDVARGPKDGKPIHIDVRMEGSPGGVPTQLAYLYRVEQETGLGSVRWKTWFDCRFSVRARQAFPPFEVISRNAPAGPIVQALALPVIASGDPQIDGQYAIHTNEPAMARVLAQQLHAFATFNNVGVHLVGDGQSVAYVMKQDKAPLLPNVLYYAEQLGTCVTAVARSVGG